MNALPLRIQDLATETYFARYPNLVTQLHQLVRNSLSRNDKAYFLAQLNEFRIRFRTEYSTTQPRTERFFQLSNLLSSAQRANSLDFAVAYTSVNVQIMLSESPFPTIELLNLQEDEIEDYYQTNTENQDVGRIALNRVMIPQMRYLRRCLAYLLVSDGWFDEASKFFFRLVRLIDPSKPNATRISEYTTIVRDAGFPRLVEGYEPTIRHAIAHAHVKMDRSNFEFTNRGTTMSADYNTFMQSYYTPITETLDLWVLTTSLRTLEDVGSHQFP